MQEWFDEYISVPWWVWIVRLAGVISGVLLGDYMITHYLGGW